MGKVILKVLEKSLKSLFKKGYEPCRAHFEKDPEGSSEIEDISWPHGDTKFLFKC